MVLQLFQQAYILFTTKLRYLFMSSPDAGFLYNIHETDGQNVLECRPASDWVDDPLTRLIVDPDNAAFVSQLRLCKRNAFPAEHEFLLCSLKESNPKDSYRPRKSVVLIERNDDGPKDKTKATLNTAINGSICEGPSNDLGPIPTISPDGPQTVESSSSETQMQASYSANNLQYLHGISSPSSSFRKRKPGDYMVFSRNGKETFVESREDSYDVGRTLILPPGTFTLSQLTTLFIGVHNLKPDYTLPNYNCYWFSGAIYKTVHKLVEGCDEKINPRVKIGKALAGVLPALPGTVKLEDFVADFETQWERMQWKIASARERTQKPMQEERQAREKAEDDARKAGDHARKAEENTQKEREAREKAEDHAQNTAVENEQLKAKLARFQQLFEGAAPATPAGASHT